MADILKINTNDNKQLYTTAIATGAGAAIGGIGGYLTKPFLKDGVLSDNFIKTAQEQLSDKTKEHLDELCGTKEAQTLVDEAKSFFNLGVEEWAVIAKNNCKEKLQELPVLYDNLKNATNMEEVFSHFEEYDEDVANWFKSKYAEGGKPQISEFKQQVLFIGDGIPKEHFFNRMGRNQLIALSQSNTVDEMQGILKNLPSDMPDNGFDILLKTPEERFVLLKESLIKSMDMENGSSFEIIANLKNAQNKEEAIRCIEAEVNKGILNKKTQ